MTLPPCPDQMDPRHILIQILTGFFPWRNDPKGKNHLHLVSLLNMSGSLPPLSMRLHDSFLNTNGNTGKKNFEVTQPVKYFECLMQSCLFISLSAGRGISSVTRRLQVSWALCSMDLPFVQNLFNLIYSKMFLSCLFPLPNSGTRSDHPNSSNEHQLTTVWFETRLLFITIFCSCCFMKWHSKDSSETEDWLVNYGITKRHYYSPRG